MGRRVSILIVEDEILLAQDIANRLEDMGYAIAGIAPSVDRAVARIDAVAHIDIVLIDIVLKGDKDGIALAQIINEKYQIPFIFLTSHSEDSVFERAKKQRPFAYILKPFQNRQVQLAIELALQNRATVKADEYQNPFSGPETKIEPVLQIEDSLFLKKDDHFERVPIKEILYLEADNSYCTVFTQNGRFIYSTVLKRIEAELPKDKFLRTHRSYVVNIEAVNGFGGNQLHLGDAKVPVPVSKSHKQEVFKLFRTL